MQLSVIIVNYNVCYFLEQCLYTVRQATAGLQAEIIVVDNASTDQSRELLPALYKDVHFIWNASNVGFGKANNQALAIARGEYLALVNPDTLVDPGVFTTILDFYAANPDAGAVGMRMFDGSGKYLPESKRGWPGAWTSFFRLSGLTDRFPNHRTLARYYLGHLPPDQVHQVDVLAGAFMVFPRKVYETVGGFDERFFMYAEDIDLSFRIKQAGYKNYYLPLPGIIHFKGESTIRDDTNADQFFQAMILFVHKYYPQKSTWWKFFLESAIKLRSIFRRPGKNEPGSYPGWQQVNWQVKGNAEHPRLLPNPPAGPVVATKDTGILYVLGPGFGLSEIMQSWEKEGIPKYMLFHGAGTGSIVGSADKNGRGEAIVLQNLPLV